MRGRGEHIGRMNYAQRVVLLSFMLLLVLSARGLSAAPPGATRAQATWTRNPLHVKILMRALAYEKARGFEKGPSLRVGVLFDPGAKDSYVTAIAAVSLFVDQIRNMTFKGLPIVVIGVPLVADDTRLLESLASNLNVAYMAPGLTRSSLERVLSATRHLGILSMGAFRDYVRWGVSLGVVLKSQRPRILVNLEAARLEGASFSSQLLQLAEIVKTEPKKEPSRGAPSSSSSKEGPGAKVKSAGGQP
jgi:YfiR/HmsC-like